MTTAAKRIDDTEAFTAMGSVSSIVDDVIVVATARGNLRCKRAVGCLIAPAIDDYVLVAGAPSGACFVLSVLEREGAGATLSVAGDLEIALDRGTLRVVARDGIELLTPRTLELAGQAIDFTADRARMVLNELSYLGATLLGELGKVRAQASTVDTVFGRVTQRVKASFRRVEEVDQLDAGSIDHKAEETMTLRAGCALVNAKQIVRVDGEQIMMG